MLAAILAFQLAGSTPLSFAQRVDGERAVERARYAFVLENTRSFDEVYPRSVFEKRVRREMDEERILRKVFGMTVTPTLLAQEFERIDKATQAPEQWAAIQKALGNDRPRIEDVFCRPLLVDRALRARFAFDQTIHAKPHQRAREARARFQAGQPVAGSSVVVLSRHGEPAPTTGEMLGKARAEASVPRVLDPVRQPDSDGPIPADPEVAAVLEKELQKPGDVTTILEERDRFEVLRLIALSPESWKVDAVRFPKRDFDSWLGREIQRLGDRPRPS
jgi:hypothetical protein